MKKTRNRVFKKFDLSRRFNLTVTKFHGPSCIMTKTSNNVFINILDFTGRTLFCKSAGAIRYDKKRNKAEPFSGTLLGNDIRRFLIKYNMRKIILIINKLFVYDLFIKLFTRSLCKGSRGVIIKQVIFRFVHAHNGCRPKKKRRL